MYSTPNINAYIADAILSIKLDSPLLHLIDKDNASRFVKNIQNNNIKINDFPIYFVLNSRNLVKKLFSSVFVSTFVIKYK